MIVRVHESHDDGHRGRMNLAIPPRPTLELMLVVMTMEERYPFGRDWASAARGVGIEVVEVEIVARSSGHHITSHIAGSGHRFQVESVSFRPDRFLRPFANLVLGSRIGRVISQVEKEHASSVDILHTHFYREMGPVLTMRNRPAHVHTEHSAAFTAIDLGRQAYHRPSAQGLRVARKGTRQAQAVTAVSQYLADQMRRYGITGPIEVIPCPVDPSVTAAALAPAQEPARVVTIGRLAPEKRVDLVLEAFALVRVQQPHLKLDIVGAGPLEDHLRSHSDRLGLAASVEWHGHVPRRRLVEITGHASAFLTATASETFGTAIAEALCLGVPVVAPRVGAIHELYVGDGSDGLLVETATAESLADALLETVNKTVDRRMIAERSRRRWSHERVGRSLSAIYERVVAGR